LKIKSQRDFWSGLLFIAAGIAFAWGATNYRFGSSAQPGPAYFPFGLGLLLALLGGVVLFKALTLEVEGGDRTGRWALRPWLVIVGAAAGFGWLLPWLGLFTAMPILVAVSALAGDEFHWKGVLVNAAVLTLGCWAIFDLGLELDVPLWPAWLGH
jgi:hypothetical protein